MTLKRVTPADARYLCYVVVVLARGDGEGEGNVQEVSGYIGACMSHW